MSIKRKTIQSYNSYAKKWAKKIRSGENTAHTYLEKPAMHKKITNLKGKNVLCVGCGTGEECQHLLKLGAWRVIGIDISEELINIAKKTFPKIDFQVADVEHLDFSTEEFDFVYSSLVMHYLKDWSPALKNIHRVLRPGGTFLFSTHHPVKWGAQTLRGKTKNAFILGYENLETVSSSGCTETTSMNEKLKMCGSMNFLLVTITNLFQRFSRKLPLRDLKSLILSNLKQFHRRARFEKTSGVFIKEYRCF